MFIHLSAEVVIPFPSEHSLRLLSPDTEHVRAARTRDGEVHGIELPETISTIWYIQETPDGEVSIPQSLRFPTQSWTEAKARAWIDSHKLEGLFEPAATQPEDSVYMANKMKILDLTIHNQIGGFGGVSSESVLAKLADPEIGAIMVDMNSPGGSVFEGMAIFNALKQHKAQIHVKITGVCASISSVIAMAGDTVEMTANSMMMIHLPTIQTQGSSSDLRKEADLLDKMQANIIATYKSKLKTDADLDKMLSEETWLSPEEAKTLGFCDLITDTAPELLDFFDFSKYRYNCVPEMVLNQYDISMNADIPDPVEYHAPSDFEKLINKLKGIFQLKKETNMSTKIKNQEEEEVIVPDAQEEEEVKKEAPMTNEEILKKLELVLAENIALKAKIGELEEAKAQEEEEVIETETTAYMENLVAKGQVRPADVAIHVESLISRRGDEEKTTAYKAMLETSPVSMEMGTHFANKVDAPELMGSAAMETEAHALYKKYRAEGNTTVTLGDCIKEAHNLSITG